MDKVLYFLGMNSLYGAIVLVIVLVLRLALRRAPKVFSYMLWAVVFFRLLCPMSLSSDISIIPDLNELLGRDGVYSESVETNKYNTADTAAYGESAVQKAELYAESTVDNAQTQMRIEAESSLPEKTAVSVEGVIFALWVSGCALMLGGNLLSWAKMKKRVSTATLKEKGVYESDRIATAFVSGIFRPKVYVPCGMEQQKYKCVLFHERTHIRRGDHIIKPIACLICCVYWFDPLVWLSLHLMCRDMEQSCDESVISSMGSKIKGDYSRMLLQQGMRNPLAFEPAFGAGSTKKRIKNVLSYKKHGKTVVALSLIAVIFAAAACTGSNGGNRAEPVTEIEAISETDEENIDLPEETEIIDAADEKKEKEVKYNIPELGDPKIIMTTNLEVGSYASFSHIADESLYVDMGDGEIFPSRGSYMVKGDTIKIYCTGDITCMYLTNLKLTSLDVSNCPSIEKLCCNNNELTKLDLSNNQALSELECGNNRITTLDLRNNPKLKSVGCSFNELTELELSGSTMLENLFCNENNIKSIDISNCKKLKAFVCYANMLTELDISKNTELERLHCYRNNITEIDRSNNPVLEVLEHDIGVVVLNEK